MTRLSTDKQVGVVSALVDGNSINAIVRMTGVADMMRKALGE